ncbi:hypothetical protein [Pelomonas aquatica]|uniref:hypothetical protein n=1 Tax=Pelomonas aquatica TaxID=431058 RepID=UPI00286D2CA2|nr:hypothetical protein [Pelomonas aquatica]
MADPVKRKKLKLTLTSLQKLTGLSLNTIRARAWALKAIDDLKGAAKKPPREGEHNTKVREEPIIDPEIVLSRKLEGLLKQNGLLYEEILYLRREVKRRDELIEKLQGGRLSTI